MNPLTKQEEEHLKLLSIFHFVLAGITALFACIPILHLIFGIIFLLNPEAFDEGDAAAGQIFGWMFVLLPAAFIVAGWTLAAFIATAGRYIKSRERRMFCLVVAAIECVFMPFGTILGVLTIIVLLREPVMEAFGDRIENTD